MRSRGRGGAARQRISGCLLASVLVVGLLGAGSTGALAAPVDAPAPIAAPTETLEPAEVPPSGPVGDPADPLDPVEGPGDTPDPVEGPSQPDDPSEGPSNPVDPDEVPSDSIEPGDAPATVAGTVAPMASPQALLAAGAAHTCAIVADGTIDCWGNDGSGRATDQTATTYTAVAAGEAHTCAITNAGTVDCWGSNTYGQATDQTATTYRAIAAGRRHTCAITTAGTVDCWGYNVNGQAEDQTATTYTAVAAGFSHTCAITTAGTVDCWGGASTFGQATDQTDTTFIAVAVGRSHSCAVTTAGTVRCWGDNGAGQATDQTGATYTAITSRFDHTCAITTAGTVDCWGLDDQGQATDQTTTTFRAVAAGNFHTCALTTAGAVDCWGSNDDGRATEPSGDFGRSTIAARWDHTCAITTVGTVECWGDDLYGQAADQTTTTYTAIAAGLRHTCAITTAATVDCWGANDDGQATDQTTTTYTAIAAGAYHTCAITTAGTVDCWGANGYDKAADQTTTTYTAIAAGLDHTCAITTIGTVDCWGRNLLGQAADQTTTTYTAIAAGAYHTCAITTAGSVDCWGDNGAGQAADQTATTYRAIAAGRMYTCGITTAGTVDCWGTAPWGALGGMPNIGSSAPPGGVLGVAYPSHPLADGAPPDVTTAWSVTAGALPAGITLGAATGRLAGTPVACGSFPFTVRASNLFGVDEQELTLVVDCPPGISPISDVSTTLGTATGAIPFYVWDGETGADLLVVAATSDDQAVLPDAGLVLGVADGRRTITVTPAPGVTGSAVVTVTVTDPTGLSASTSFRVTVSPLTGSISGTAMAAGAPIGGVLVAAYAETDGFAPTAVAVTAADGTYAVTGLPAGPYRVAFVPLSATGLRISWHGPADSRTAAAVVPVTDTTAVTGIDGTLGSTATISGTVTGPDGSPLAGVRVRAVDADDTWIPSGEATTAADGSYAIVGLSPGSYKLHLVPPGGSLLRTEWIGGGRSRAAGTDFVVVEGQTLSGVDVGLLWDNVLAGTATMAGLPVAGVTVQAFQAGSIAPVATTTTGVDGTWALTRVPAGTVRLRFLPPAGSGQPNQWWPGAATRDAALEITVVEGTRTTDVDTTWP